MIEKMRLLAGKLGPLIPLLVRFTLGVVFTQSGWGKLHNLEKVIGFFTDLGIPAPQIQAPFVAGTEIACGAALLLGLFTRLAALPVIAMMVVAIATAKKGDIDSWSDVLGFIEYLYMVLALYVVAYGPGRFSLDALLFKLDRRSLGLQKNAA